MNLLPVLCFGLCGQEAPVVLGPGLAVRDLQREYEYFANSWSVIGLPDLAEAARVTPRGELLLGAGRLVQPLVGAELCPLSRRLTKTLPSSRLPLVRWRFALEDGVEETLEALAVPDSEPDGFRCLQRTLVRNTASAPARFTVGWNLPGAALELQASSGLFSVRDAQGGLLAAGRAPLQSELLVQGSRLIARGELDPGAGRELVLALPFRPLESPSPARVEELARQPFDAAAEEQRAAWEALLSRGATLHVPEAKVQATWDASLVYQLIGMDQGELHAGEGFYDTLYIRDGSYQALSMAQAGFVEIALRALEPFFARQQPDGRFGSQPGELDANGYAQWALLALAEISGDEAFLARAFPAMRRAAAWTAQARRRERDPGPRFRGLLPAAQADGENLWAGRNHIVGYDFWNLRGLESTARAAQRLGQPAVAEVLSAEARDYRAAILVALESSGCAGFPPSYEGEGTHWGDLEACFPTPLFAPRDPRVGATLEFVTRDFGAADGPRGFVEGVIQWTPGTGALHPYLAQFVTHARILRGEREAALEGFYSFLLHTTSTHGFPEGVYYRRREAWADTLPHLWAAALYVSTLRSMLLREEGDELHLFSAVPARWFVDETRLALERAPTHFGVASLVAESSRARIRLRLDVPQRNVPRRVRVHMPLGLELLGARLDGRAVAVPDALELTLETHGLGERLDLELDVTRAAQEPCPGFVERCAAYEAAERERNQPIPGVLPAAPTGVDPHLCRELDLAPACTTDPRRGPFLVDPAPSFGELPAGEVRVGDIPFRLVDPAQNAGKGLVVLQGDSACAALPSEARIAGGGARGRTLCCLGNVTGWGPGDPGVQPDGAVARLEVRYADGTSTAVPWITGRTCEDWLGAAQALDLAPGLAGPGWHLGVLVVALEEKPIEWIVLRDLGTPASPVLAALTVVP